MQPVLSSAPLETAAKRYPTAIYRFVCNKQQMSKYPKISKASLYNLIPRGFVQFSAFAH